MEIAMKIGKLEVMDTDLGGEMSWTDATKACQALGGGWRLPTRDELTTLYENRDAIGGFSADRYDLYWSSTRIYATSAWVRVFADAKGVEDSHTGEAHVRAVRTI